MRVYEAKVEKATACSKKWVSTRRGRCCTIQVLTKGVNDHRKFDDEDK